MNVEVKKSVWKDAEKFPQHIKDIVAKNYLHKKKQQFIL
jgi:hypothetical protein